MMKVLLVTTLEIFSILPVLLGAPVQSWSTYSAVIGNSDKPAHKVGLVPPLPSLVQELKPLYEDDWRTKEPNNGPFAPSFPTTIGDPGNPNRKLYQDILNAFKTAQLDAKQSPLNVTAIRNVLHRFFNAFTHTFQEFVNKQQAFLDMINCPTCGANPWQNFLSAMGEIPTFGWVLRPPHGGEKPTGSFIAATNVNGVVNGVGGSIYTGDPVVEYTFNNNHVTPIKPKLNRLSSAELSEPRIRTVAKYEDDTGNLSPIRLRMTP